MLRICAGVCVFSSRDVTQITKNKIFGRIFSRPFHAVEFRSLWSIRKAFHLLPPSTTPTHHRNINPLTVGGRPNNNYYKICSPHPSYAPPPEVAVLADAFNGLLLHQCFVLVRHPCPCNINISNNVIRMENIHRHIIVNAISTTAVEATQPNQPSFPCQSKPSTYPPWAIPSPREPSSIFRWHPEIMSM